MSRPRYYLAVLIALASWIGYELNQKGFAIYAGLLCIVWCFDALTEVVSNTGVGK